MKVRHNLQQASVVETPRGPATLLPVLECGFGNPQQYCEPSLGISGFLSDVFDFLWCWQVALQVLLVYAMAYSNTNRFPKTY